MRLASSGGASTLTPGPHERTQAVTSFSPYLIGDDHAPILALLRCLLDHLRGVVTLGPEVRRPAGFDEQAHLVYFVAGQHPKWSRKYSSESKPSGPSK